VFRQLAIFIFFVQIGAGLWMSPLLAQDKDDELKPTDHPKLSFDPHASPESSASLENQFPEQAAEIRAFIAAHVSRAHARDIDGYMSDFVPTRLRHPEIQRDYAERAMALEDLQLSLVAIEFQQIQPRSATLHTRQIATYRDEHGQPVVDDAIISYRLQKTDSQWQIQFTERRRLAVE